MQLTVFRTGEERWVLVQRFPIVNAEIRRAFARMDQGLKRILLEQEQRRRATAVNHRISAVKYSTGHLVR